MATLFYDTFQGAGEAIQDHTSDSGGGWEKPYGSPLLVTDAARPYVAPANYGFNVAAEATGYAYPTTAACMTATFDITYTPGVYAGLVQIMLGYQLSPDIYFSVTLYDSGPVAEGSGIVSPIPVVLPQGVNSMEIRANLASSELSYVLNDDVVATVSYGDVIPINMIPSIFASDGGSIRGAADITFAFTSVYLFNTLTPTPTPPGHPSYWWNTRINVDVEPLE